MNGWTWFGVVVATLLLSVAVLSAYGRKHWSEQTAQLIQDLEAARVAPQPTHVDFRELVGLPPPVQRYFRLVLRACMRIPITGEVAWLLLEGRKPYWRGTITAMNFT